MAPTDPLSPADERKQFTLPPGFDVQLVASEPDVIVEHLGELKQILAAGGVDSDLPVEVVQGAGAAEEELVGVAAPVEGQAAARAGRLLGAADSVRESVGIERSRFDGEWLDRHLGRVGGDEFETARQAGSKLDAEQALHEARNPLASNDV